jgi:hypothetical protein
MYNLRSTLDDPPNILVHSASKKPAKQSWKTYESTKSGIVWLSDLCKPFKAEFQWVG